MSSPRVRVHSARGRYHIRWFCEDSGDWREILDDFKYEFMPHEREFNATTKTWSVPLHCRARVRAWASRWFDADQREYVEGDPAGGSYGSRTYSDSHSGDSRYGRVHGRTSAVDDAYRVLHLCPSAPPELVQAAHRILIKRVHPDRGGSHEDAVRLNAAWELVRSDLERRAS